MTTVESDGEALVVRFGGEGPFDVFELVQAFEGIAVEFRFTLERHGLSAGRDGDVRLLVRRLESGSIEAELIPGLEVLGAFLPFVDRANLLLDFGERIGRIVSWFAGRTEAEPPEDVTDKELTAVMQTVAPVARRPGGFLELRYRNEKPDGGSSALDLRFGEAELGRAALRMQEARDELRQKEVGERRRLDRVLMVLHQASRDAGVPPGKRSPDKAVIEAISPRPLPVHFVPEALELKDRMIEREENPFALGLVVDVDVQTRRGKPALYIIRAVHDVVPLDTGDEDRDPEGTG